MEQVIRAQIPIHIKNVENPAGSGTIIYPSNTDIDMTTHTQQRLPTAVTIKDDICVLNVHSNRKNVSHGFLAKIFEILDEHGIVVDLISTSEVHVSMALGPDAVRTSLEKAMPSLQSLGRVSHSSVYSIRIKQCIFLGGSTPRYGHLIPCWQKHEERDWYCRQNVFCIGYCWCEY